MVSSHYVNWTLNRKKQYFLKENRLNLQYYDVQCYLLTFFCLFACLGYDDEGIEELRQNQGKQLLDDLKDSLENGRSLEVQDENGATAVSKILCSRFL